MTLAASISVQEAARQEWDVVVVGAGPAGALAAHQLAGQGLAVLLTDQASFPRWKVCGCCLNGRALAALGAAGLGEVTASARAVVLEDMLLAAGGRSVQLQLVEGRALSREALDAALIEAAMRRGAAFLPQARAALAPEKDSPERACRHLWLYQGTESLLLEARCLLAADGLGGKLLARAGIAQAKARAGARIGTGVICPEAPDFYRPGTVYMSCGQAGYLGLVRLEDGRLNLAAALDATAVRKRGGAGELAADLLGAAGWPAIAGLSELTWRGTPALTRQASRRAAERLFVLGDAAGYVEPFTGEGMAWALASGVAVAPLAARAVRGWRPSLGRSWEELHRRIVRRRQVACRSAALLLRHIVLARAIVVLLGHLPSLARPLLQALNRP